MSKEQEKQFEKWLNYEIERHFKEMGLLSLLKQQETSVSKNA